jgi:hypothetical protein
MTEKQRQYGENIFECGQRFTGSNIKFNSLAMHTVILHLYEVKKRKIQVFR